MQTVQLKNGHVLALNPDDALDLTEAVREHLSADLADLIREKMERLKNETPEDCYEPCLFSFLLKDENGCMECHLDMNSENGRNFMRNLIENRNLHARERKTGTLADDGYFRYLLRNMAPEDVE